MNDGKGVKIYRNSFPNNDKVRMSDFMSADFYFLECNRRGAALTYCKFDNKIT